MKELGLARSGSIVLSLFLILGATPRGQSTATAKSSVMQIRATSSADLRNWESYITQARRAGDLRLRSSIRDPLTPTHTTERFDQFYQGIPIWGSDVVVDSDNGAPASIFGVLSPDSLALNVSPALSIEQARLLLTGSGGKDGALRAEPSLVIARLENGEHYLTYSAVVFGAGRVDRVFLDAQTGAEVLRYSELHKQTAAVGTGTGVLGDSKKLSVEKTSSGSYTAYDRHRPPVIETFDMRGNLARTKLLFYTSLFASASDLASDTDNIWTGVAVVDAHVHVSWTYDYYYKRFGRSGLDGRNGPINIAVNAVTQQGSLSIAAEDSSWAVNAFWCRAPCGPTGQGVMFFGDGIPPGYYMPDSGRNYTYFGGALDIAAHELTHAVTTYTSNLTYQNESGALNEAFSDMMGKSVEFYYHPAGGAVGQADYVIGKDISRAVRPGSISGDRSMANPGLYGDPDHYSRRAIRPNTPAGDYGGVHTNSGIANQAFYLAIEGGTNRTSGLVVTGVGSGNRDQIEKTFFRAFTVLMPASSTFSTARAATIQAARDLYGAGSNAERAVIQAWTAVGVS